MHANDRLDALLSGKTEAAALMEPLVSRALAAGARKIADLRWRGGIVAGANVDDETAAKLRRALNRAIAWLRENERRSRDEVLRDLAPEARAQGLMPELVGVQTYQARNFRRRSTGCSTAASSRNRRNMATWCAANNATRRFPRITKPPAGKSPGA